MQLRSEPPLASLALRHSRRGRHDAAEADLGRQWSADRLQHTPRAVLVTEAELDGRRGTAIARHPLTAGDELRDIVAVRVVEGWSIDQLVRHVPEHRLDRRALVANDALGVDDRDDVTAALDQGTELRLAASEVRQESRALERGGQDPAE